MDMQRLLQAITSGERENLLSELKENIPSKLHKFVWLDGSANDEKKFNSLENGDLWISKIGAFNDPFEFKGFAVDGDKFKKKGFSDDELQTLMDCFDSSETYGVCCLSNVSIDYLPMWAYYTNTHQGFCIEYEVLNNDYLYEVLYEPKRIIVCDALIELGLEINKLAKPNSDADLKKISALTSMFLLNLLIKSASWKHECEFRVATFVGNALTSLVSSVHR